MAVSYMLNIKGRPLNYLRFGLARTKDLLKDISRIYDGLVIPANILLYQYKSTPAIVYNLNQPYFVDPMSYLFAHPFEKFKKKIEKGVAFKPSFVKLMAGYGLNSQDFIGKTNSLVDYLREDTSNLTRFTENCMDFQYNSVYNVMKEAKDLVDGIEENKCRPAFLIPPYFLYKRTGDSIDLNFEILEQCANAEHSEWFQSDIFPVIFLDKECLSDDVFLKRIVEKVQSHPKYTGFFLWINDFDERLAQENEIAAVIRLISKLSNNGKYQVGMLFGGFYSLLTKVFGLNCICHGLAYSEHRHISLSVSQSSGPAPVRYYISDLHQFFTIETALKILRVRKDLMCECPICQRVLRGDPENVTKFLEEETLAILHFLYNRNSEKEMVSKLTPSDVVKYLNFLEVVNKDLKKLTNTGSIGDKPVIGDQMGNWKKAFQAQLDE